ncbi:hypothetical protein Tco_0438446 [Tanacetum coccineum]
MSSDSASTNKLEIRSFTDSEQETSIVWIVFQPLLHPMVTLPMHHVRELQEHCRQQAEGLEYKAKRNGNLAKVEVFIDAQKKMAQKLGARNALAALKIKKPPKPKRRTRMIRRRMAAKHSLSKP